MINQKLQSDSRNRGTGHGLPSVSRFQSGHMPSGITTAIRVETYMSESDMDTCSDSEVEGRYSLETSPQDDKVPNGFLLNLRVGSTSGGGFSAARRGFVEEDVSSGSASGSEVSRKNGFVVEKKFRMGANFRGTDLQPGSESVRRQEFRNATLQNNFDDGVPSAPPVGGSFQHENQVSEKLQTLRTDAKPSLSTAGCSSAEVNAEDSSRTKGERRTMDTRNCCTGCAGVDEVYSCSSPVRRTATPAPAVSVKSEMVKKEENVNIVDKVTVTVKKEEPVKMNVGVF